MLESIFGTEDVVILIEQVQTQITLSCTNIDSLPSALWVFSTSFLSTRSSFKERIAWYLWIALPLVYSIGLEGLQLVQVTDGTYDPNDVQYSIIGWVCGMSVAKLIDLSTTGCSIPYYYLGISYLILILGNVW
jgi:hypothetical protein